MLQFLQNHTSALLAIVLTVMLLGIRLFLLWKELNDVQLKDDGPSALTRITYKSQRYSKRVADAA